MKLATKKRAMSPSYSRQMDWTSAWLSELTKARGAIPRAQGWSEQAQYGACARGLMKLCITLAEGMWLRLASAFQPVGFVQKVGHVPNLDGRTVF